ncbi:MAG TPA: patatin-like phospholipase family protein, partial [Polyangiaceae bacterium]
VRARTGLSPDAPLTGLALSGGGVRSATVSLGFLEELAKRDLLTCFDYLSSVSGGSYASGYLYSAATEFGDARHAQLFGPEAKRELLATGKYLAFGSGLQSVFRLIRLLAAFLSTSFLNLLWMFFLTVAASSLFVALGRTLSADFDQHAACVTYVALGLAVCVPLLRLLAMTLANLVGGSTQIVVGKAVNVIEGWNVLVCGGLFSIFWFAPWLTKHTLYALACSFKAPPRSSPWCFNWTAFEHCTWAQSCDCGPTGTAVPTVFFLALALASGVVALVLGFLVSSDAIGLYSVFKNLIDSGYLNAGSRAKANRPGRSPGAVAAQARVQTRKRLLLHELRSDRNPAFKELPYPLYNAVAYLQRKIPPPEELRSPEQPHARGRHSPDYFLFSPLHCGAFTTGYARLGGGGKLGDGDKVYDQVSLADAVTCSAASLTPLMHGDTSRLTAVALLVANLNLSSWFANPNPAFRRTRVAFWPLRYLKMLFGKIYEDCPFIPVADGAFTDNLGVIELLR